jgi:hypothetical protein
MGFDIVSRHLGDGNYSVIAIYGVAGNDKPAASFFSAKISEDWMIFTVLQRDLQVMMGLQSLMR